MLANSSGVVLKAGIPRADLGFSKRYGDFNTSLLRRGVYAYNIAGSGVWGNPGDGRQGWVI